jgi:hypothetical protein
MRHRTFWKWRERLSFVAADLENDADQPEAVTGANTCCTWRRPFLQAFLNTKIK